MKHNSLVLLKAAVAVLLMYGFLSSCAPSKGCKGLSAHPKYSKSWAKR
jgi:hypothetical protein